MGFTLWIPLVMTDIAIENGQWWPIYNEFFPVEMVIFHSDVNVYQRVTWSYDSSMGVFLSHPGRWKNGAKRKNTTQRVEICSEAFKSGIIRQHIDRRLLCFWGFILQQFAEPCRYSLAPTSGTATTEHHKNNMICVLDSKIGTCYEINWIPFKNETYKGEIFYDILWNHVVTKELVVDVIGVTICVDHLLPSAVPQLLRFQGTQIQGLRLAVTCETGTGAPLWAYTYTYSYAYTCTFT